MKDAGEVKITNKKDKDKGFKISLHKIKSNTSIHLCREKNCGIVRILCWAD